MTRRRQRRNPSQKFPRNDIQLFYLSALDGREVEAGVFAEMNDGVRKDTRATLTGYKQWAYAGKGYVYEARTSDGRSYWTDDWKPVGWTWDEIRQSVIAEQRSQEDTEKGIVEVAIRPDVEPPDDRVAAIVRTKTGFAVHLIGKGSTLVLGSRYDARRKKYVDGYPTIKQARQIANDHLIENQKPSWADKFTWRWQKVRPVYRSFPVRPPEPLPPQPKIVNWAAVPSVGLVMRTWPRGDVAQIVANAIGGTASKHDFYNAFNVVGPLPATLQHVEIEAARAYLESLSDDVDLLNEARDELSKRSQELWALADNRPLFDGERIDSEFSRPPPIEVIAFSDLSDEAGKRSADAFRRMLPPSPRDPNYRGWPLEHTKKAVDQAWNLAHNLWNDKALRKEWRDEGLGDFTDETDAFWQAVRLLSDRSPGILRGRLQKHVKLFGRHVDTDYVRPEEASDIVAYLSRVDIPSLPDSILARYFNRIVRSKHNPWPGSYTAPIHNQMEFYQNELRNEILRRLQAYAAELGPLRDPSSLKPGDTIDGSAVEASQRITALRSDLTDESRQYFWKTKDRDTIDPDLKQYWSKPYSTRPWMR